MLFDSHCHIWQTWPYQPPVPDPQTRARAEQLLFEMDQNGVERAVVICAAIGENPRNADYAFEMAARHPGRLVVFPDLECRWSATYRQPGAARRLEEALARWDFAGFTHYPEPTEDCSWLSSDEGLEFFEVVSRRSLIASFSVLPHQLPAVIELAKRHPRVPMLCHHLMHFGTRTPITPAGLAELRAAAALPNIFVKVSGMGNVTTSQDEFPYPRLSDLVVLLRDIFGPERLLWGSDYPVSRRHMTYRQTISMVLKHFRFEGSDLDHVLGGNMSRLLLQ